MGRQWIGRWRLPSGWMALGTLLVVTSVVGALLAFGLPGFGFGGKDRPRTPTQTAQAFFDAVRDGECEKIPKLTWFSLDREDQRRDARTTCEQNTGSFAGVELGKPRAGAKSQAPFDVAGYLVVPVKVTLPTGERRDTALQLVQVDGRWYVTG